MRRKIKRQLIELLTTLIETRKPLETLIASGQSTVEILAQQQQAAVAVGSRIEEWEGEGTAAVKCLETYCEVLWELSQTTAQLQQLALLEKACNILVDVKAETEALPEQLDIAFLPYKASMWDCMETVWQAAQEDPNCNAYVIPIPYYDKLPDGSFGEQHYEGDMFPEYVPITPYQDYLLMEKHPEIIYIHNPFDEYNHVTSVAPEFYSTQLRKCTDTLVYIPYFMQGQKISEAHGLLPAYLQADKIVLQNDLVVKDIDSRIPREKLLVLGSPKAEKVLRLQEKREELLENGIPEFWRAKASGKKVVLYNTSISGILENSKSAIDKMRYVFSVFEKREDVVLLWRPHPLIESTLESMVPELLKEYRRLKKEFQEKNFGIYDDTPDVAVAAVIADAYIGEDTSSVVQYFSVLGKPVFILDWNVTDEWTEEERAALSVTDCFAEEGCLWFVPCVGEAYYYLCRMDLQTGEVELCYELPGLTRNPTRGGAYWGICKVKNKVVMTPAHCDDIYIYDVKSKEAVKLPVKETVQYPLFTGALRYGDEVVLPPRNYPAVAVVNPENASCTYYEIPDIWKSIQEETLVFGWGSCIYEDKLYVPFLHKNAILEFDLKTKIFTEKQIPGTGVGFNAVIGTEGQLWLTADTTSEIVCYNLTTGEANVVKQLPEGFEGGAEPYFNMIEVGEEIWIFPLEANMILAVDKKCGMVTELQLQRSYTERERRLPRCAARTNYCLVRKEGQEILAMSTSDYRLLKCAGRSGKNEEMVCRLKEADRRILECKKLHADFSVAASKGYVREDVRWSLDIFADYLVSGMYVSEKRVQKEFAVINGKYVAGCGEVIHRAVKMNEQVKNDTSG